VPKALHLDFETCSKINLTRVGAHVYARHPSTQVICASYALNDGPVETTDFRQGLDGLREVDKLLRREDADLHGWNVVFERLIWNNVVAPAMKLAPIRPDQTVCTMATAALYGLPLKLETAALVSASAHQKNTAGRETMLRMSRPRKDPPLTFWHQSLNQVELVKLAILLDYNRDDVEAERAISNSLPKMTDFERRVWLADQRMNDRGLPVDRDFLVAALEMTRQEMDRLSLELQALTSGIVKSIHSVGALTQWVKDRGYPSTFTLSKQDVELVLNHRTPFPVTSEAYQALLIRQEAAKSSTAKLKAIDNFAPKDGRARGLVQYGGAIRTLRWAGRGVQIQNFPRPTVKHPEIAADAITRGAGPDVLADIFGAPLDVIASCLRGAFKAPQGMKFAVMDFSGVEARVLAWLAGNRAALKVFREGQDIYKFTAASIGSSSRQLGKVLVLACGFGMGPDRFMATANAPPYNLGLTREKAEDAVYAFRDANPEIVAYWRVCENAAKAAISNPDKRFTVGGSNGAPVIIFRMANPGKSLKGALLIKLPSGRHLIYRKAQLIPGTYGQQVAYEGNDVAHHWDTIGTWGGKIAENITQAVARDLLAYAVVDLADMHDETMLTTSHDEIIALTGEAEAQTLYAEMRAAMQRGTSWSTGLPLAASGFIADRYGK
jgi:DNA polymerase bacteriophage-type